MEKVRFLAILSPKLRRLDPKPGRQNTAHMQPATWANKVRSEQRGSASARVSVRQREVPDWAVLEKPTRFAALRPSLPPEDSCWNFDESRLYYAWVGLSFGTMESSVKWVWNFDVLGNRRVEQMRQISWYGTKTWSIFSRLTFAIFEFRACLLRFSG